MTDEFDPQALEALLAEALRSNEETPHSTIFRFGDTKVLSVIDQVLANWMPQAEKALALAELREHLFADTVSTSPQQLHTLVNHVKTKGKVAKPYWNIQNPDVVFVSDVPPYGKAGEVLAGCLKDSGFSSRHVAWTFWNRTGYDDEDISKWLPYTYAELRSWNPKLIVTLGAEASVQILGDITKLAEVRGVVHWVGPWPVMPTYSPLYADKAKRLDHLVQDLSRAHEFAYGNMRTA
jgi:uracil-DNA glycosylase